MAATLVGEAAIRIVPTIRGFKYEADRRLREVKLEPVKVKIHADTREAEAKMDEWRAKQDLKPVIVPVKTDSKGFERDLKQIENRVRDSPLRQLTTFNIKILGLDALPALAYAAASAAAGLDALGESVLALPGILGGVGASVGALALGLDGLKSAFSAYQSEQKTSQQTAHQLTDDNRTLQRSYRDYRDAVRDTTREIQDLNAENRRSSLNKADALLSIQEAADRLRQGGFSSVTEMQRAQLSYAEAIDHYNDVLTKSNRTQEDANRANAEGVMGSDRVSSALDSINKNIEKLDQDKVGNFGRALAKLAPNAAAAVTALLALRGQYTAMQREVQNNLFAGMDKDITNLATRLLPTLQVGLARVATGLNANFSQAFRTLGSDRNKGFLSQIFANDAGMLQELSKGINPLINAVIRLTTVSSDFLPRLGDAADKVFGKFDAWTDKIANDGSLRQWTDQGLKAMDAIGNIGLGIISVIHKIGQAFDDVSGHQGGFLQTFADELKKLNGPDHLGSASGMAKLEGYLRGAKSEFLQIKGAWDTMKPAVKELIGYAREFSAESLNILGTTLKLVAGFDNLTHAVGPLLQFFLAVRSIKQGIGIGQDLFHMAGAPQRGLSQAKAWWGSLGQASKSAADDAKAAAAEVDEAQTVAAASSKKLGDEAEKTGTKMDAASTRAKAMTTNVTNFVSPARTAADAATTLGGNAERAGILLTNTGNGATAASNGIAQAGKSAEEAGEKIGGAGSSMMSKVKGLAGALGSGLSSMGLTLAIGVAITAVEQLGAAHRQAAQDAQAQANATDALADSLDKMTGAATNATMQNAAESASKFTVPGLNDKFKQRNLLQDITKTGTGISPQMYVQSLNPVNTDVRNQYVAQLDQATLAQLPQDPLYQRFKTQFDNAGLDQATLAKAINGDPDALAKVQAAAGQGFKFPDLAQLLSNLPNMTTATSALGLRNLGGGLLARGQQDQAIQNATAGKWRLNAAGKSAFPFSVDTVTKDGDTGVIVFSGHPPPGWSQNGELPDGRGSVTSLPGNRFRVDLSPDETNRLLVPGFSQGGLVRGPGTGTSDSILTRLSNREHVSQAAAVKYYGTDVFDAMNNMAIPQSVVMGWLGKVPGHYTGGFGGFKMTGPSPAPPPPRPPDFGPNDLIPNTGHGGGPQIFSKPGPVTQWHVVSPPAPAAAPPTPKAPLPAGSQPAGAPGSPGGPSMAFGGGQAPGSLSNPGLAGGPLDTSGLPGYHNRAGATAPAPGVGTPAMPTPGLAPVETPFGPMTVPGGGLTASSVIQAAQSVAGRVPYVWGGFGPNGFDCSGLAAWLSNIATGRDPFGGGRFSTGNEGPELAARGFIAGPGGPGELTIGWNADHTGITLPDGEHIDAEDEKDGIVLNGHSPGATGFPNVMHLPAGLGDGLGGMLPGGVPGQLMDGSASPMGGMGFRLRQMFNPQNMWNNIVGHYMQAYSPQNIMQFLGGQAQQAGQDILGIFTQLVGGMTGLNLGPLIGYGGQLGNYGLSMIQSPGGSGSGGGFGMSGLNSMAGQDLNQFIGAGGLQIGGGGSMGGGSAGGGGGGEQYRPMIRQALQQYGPMMGIPQSAYQQWEDALVKQINTESSGSTTITSSAGDVGLLQFKPGTFQEFNLTGGSITDPYAQIVAALYRLTKGGPNAYDILPDGGPAQIGQGVGWATGGFPLDGLAWISNGEYRSNNAATGFYGSEAYNALNGMQIPRSQVQAFMSKGFKGVSKFSGGGFNGQEPNNGGSPWRTMAQLGSSFVDDAAMVAAKFGSAALGGGESALGGVINAAGKVAGPAGILAPFLLDAIDPQAHTSAHDTTPFNPGKRVPKFSGGGWSGAVGQVGHAISSGAKKLWHSFDDKPAQPPPGTKFDPDGYELVPAKQPPKQSLREQWNQLWQMPHFSDGGFSTSVPNPWPIQPPQPAPSRGGISDTPNINQIVGPDAGQQAANVINQIGGAIGGAAGASGGGGGGGSSSGSNGPITSPKQRLGPPPQTPPAVPPAPGTAGGLGGPGGIVKSDGSTKSDNRGGIGMVGPAPKTLDHLNPAISKTVASAAGTIGSWAAMAAQAAITAGAAGASFGAGAPAGAAAGAFASQGIQAGAQMAGEAINDGLNVLAGFAVRNQGPANGSPLLAQRNATSMAPPVMQKIHNGDIQVDNLEEWKRANETMEAQQAMPWIGKYW